MKVTIFLALACVGALASVDEQVRFAQFVQEFNKEYAAQELFYRFNIFNANVRTINEHNAGDHSWTMAVNEFADMTSEEFSRHYLGYNPRATPVGDRLHEEVGSPAASVDWSQRGATTAVKNQGGCGSCWAFSTTGAIEGALFLSSGRLTSLSEQQLVDCAGSYGNEGCNGGLMDNAFSYVQKNGIASESAYPYKGTDGSCKSFTAVGRISGHTDVRATESALVSALNGQPVSVAVDANTWQFYSSGIYSGCSSRPQLDHGVLAVGYDSSSIKIKNSWGTRWGESGFIRLTRGQNECGVQNGASYPRA